VTPVSLPKPRAARRRAPPATTQARVRPGREVRQRLVFPELQPEGVHRRRRRRDAPHVHLRPRRHDRLRHAALGHWRRLPCAGSTPTPYHGKRIRFSAYVKCKDLANWGSIWLFTADFKERVYATDDIAGGPIMKTTDWTRLEIVCDVDPQVETIRAGVHMRGKGQIWMDSPQIEIVPNTVPITDDQIWHPWSFSPPALFDQARPDDGAQRQADAPARIKGRRVRRVVCLGLEQPPPRQIPRQENEAVDVDQNR
jgi:hypothetical protein